MHLVEQAIIERAVSGGGLSILEAECALAFEYWQHLV